MTAPFPPGPENPAGQPHPSAATPVPVAGGTPYQPALPVPASAPTGPVLVTVGDITVEQHRIVTPSGILPTKGATWTAQDMSRTEERMPVIAIVLAILFFPFCLLGLLFLLMKEKRTEGFVQVTVTGGGRSHSALVPVNSPQQVADILARVNYARSVAF